MGGGDGITRSGEYSSQPSGIIENSGAYAAIRSDGSVVTWGQWQHGGDSTNANNALSAIDFDGPTNDLKVTSIIPTLHSTGNGAMAAIRSDGSVVTWGQQNYGGDSSSVDFVGINNDLTVGNDIL